MGNAVNELKKIVYGDAPATAGTSSVDRLRNIVAGKEKISVTPENSYAYKQKNKPAPRVESVAQSSTPTFGERVASTFSGFFDRQKSNYAGAAENLLEIVRDLDKKNSEQFRKANTEAENAARYQKMLDEGKWADGTILTAEDRKRVQSLMEDSKKRSAIYAESNEKIHQPISNVISKVETYGDEKATASEEALAKAKEGAGTLGKVAVDLGVVAGDVATDALMNAMIPGLGSAARATRMYGQGAEAAEDKGRGLGAQALYGGTTAALGELSNRMFNSNPILQQAFGKGALDDVILPGLNATKAGRIFKSGLGEALEETGENYADKIAQALIFREDADKLDAKDIGYDALIAALFGSASSAVSPAPRNRLQQSSASLTASSEGSNAPDVKAPQNAPESVSEGVSEQAKIPQFGNDLLNIAADEQVANGRPTKSMVEAIIKSPEALQELGVNSNGKTNSQLRAEVRQSIERFVTEGEVENTALAEEGSTDIMEEETPKLFTAKPEAEIQATIEGDGLGAADLGFDLFTNAQNEYGTLPSGENPVRSDDVPVSTDGETKVSQSVVTAKGAAVTPDEFVPLLENETMKNGYSFIPITNDESVQSAEKTIMDKGWAQARADWTADVRAGKAGDQITAIGALLYNNAVNAGDERAALDIFADYQYAVRNSARGLQAARILKTLTPQSRLYMIERSIQNMVDSMGLKEPIAIPDDLLTKYRDAKTEADRDATIDEIQQYVAERIPPSLKDMWTALRYTNMLGNFKTQIRNVSGNIGMRVVAEVQNAVATFLEAITGGKYGKTRSVFVDSDLKKAAKNDFANVKDLALRDSKYKLGDESASAFASGVNDKRTIFKIDSKNEKLNKAVNSMLAPLEAYRKATDWAMNNEYFGDAAFMKGAYARYLGGYLQANKVTAEQFNSPEWQKAHRPFVDKARQFALKQAQEVTFRDSNTLSDWVSSLGRKPSTPKAVRAISEGALPFRKTPANVLMRAEEYSPLGLINTAVEAKKAAGGKATGTDVINAFSKALTGTGIFIAGMALAANGMLRGKGTDDEEQDAFDELNGHQDYSLVLPDGTSITLDWLTPASMPLFMGAEFERLREEAGFNLKDLEASLTSLAEPMVQMSMLQGVNDTLNDLQYAQNANFGQIAATLALNYLTQGLTNSLVGQISRSTKEDSMMTYVDKESPVPDWLQRELGSASRKLPGKGYNQIPYIDAWGRTESTGDPLERAANNLLNPAYVSQVDVDNVEKELQRLYDAVGSEYGSLFPDRAAKYITDAKGNRKDFTADEYVAYAKDLGQTTYNLISEAMKTSAYKSGSNAAKAEYIDRIYGYAGALARSKAGGKPLEGYQLNAKNAKRDIGVSSAEYLALYEKYGSEVMSGKAYEKVKQAVKAGLSVDEYVSAKNKANTDGKTGVNKEEAMAFLKNNPKRADLWDIINTTGANNPYK